ncbi:MAG: hypothetical protein U1F43_10605 [Myxococcota bacterium]
MSLARPARLILALGLALGALTSAAAHAFDACKAGQTVAGSWRFTTLVTQAKQKAGKGVNGFYQLALAVDADCKLHATLTKTGYGKVTFKPKEVLSGTADVVADSIPPQSEGLPPEAERPEIRLDFPVTLASAAGPTGADAIGVSFELIVQGDKLFGRWEYRGAAWDSAGMAGSLMGARGAGKAVAFKQHKQIDCDMACVLEGYYIESNSKQMCEARCQEGDVVGAGKKQEVE